MSPRNKEECNKHESNSKKFQTIAHLPIRNVDAEIYVTEGSRADSSLESVVATDDELGSAEYLDLRHSTSLCHADSSLFHDFSFSPPIKCSPLWPLWLLVKAATRRALMLSVSPQS